MRTSDGRAVLRRILEHAGVFDSSYTSESRDHAYHDGRRSEGLWLLREMQEANPETLGSILTEILTHDRRY